MTSGAVVAEMAEIVLIATSVHGQPVTLAFA